MPHLHKCPTCQKEFESKKINIIFCSKRCVRWGELRALDAALIEEAERVVPRGCNRRDYVADKLGVKPQSVTYMMLKMGLKWIDRRKLLCPRQEALRTQKHDRRWARSIGCAVCGEKRCTQACHIVPAHRVGMAEEGNLIPLCLNHHFSYDTGLSTEDELSAMENFIRGIKLDAVPNVRRSHGAARDFKRVGFPKSRRLAAFEAQNQDTVILESGDNRSESPANSAVCSAGPRPA